MKTSETDAKKECARTRRGKMLGEFELRIFSFPGGSAGPKPYDLASCPLDHVRDNRLVLGYSVAS